MSIFRTALRTTADKTLVPFLRYLFAKVAADLLPHHSALYELNMRTAIDCANYLETNMVRALEFDKKDSLWEYSIANKKVDGLIAEFGVFDGHSINFFAKKLSPLTVYGFDSFEGLNVDWSGAGLPKGTFNRNGKLPTVEINVSLIKGWFDQTVP